MSQKMYFEIFVLVHFAICIFSIYGENDHP